MTAITAPSPTHLSPTRLEITKGDIFRQLTKNLTRNEYGLPDYIYRADIIPANFFQCSTVERNSILAGAILPINWDHGYPAIEEATPIWEKLPGESVEAFNAFVHYLDLPQQAESNNPVRMLPLLSQALNIAYTILSDYAHTYFWAIRFRAYDLYLLACHQKQKELRMMTIEGRHYTLAEKFLKKVDTILNKRLEHDMREIEDEDSAIHQELKLKDLVDIVQKLTTIQRVSLGMPANGNDTSDGAQVGKRNQQVDDAFKEIASYASPAKKSNERGALMDHLLSDPKALAAAQELILKASR